MSLPYELTHPISRALGSSTVAPNTANCASFRQTKTCITSERISLIVLRLFVMTYVIGLVLLEFLFVMPAIFGTISEIPLSCHMFMLYFSTGFLSSCFLLVRTDPSIRGHMLANKVSHNWTYCIECQTSRPPRSHHCRTCRTCILRSDHHCVILGQCVGLANWRYFYSLLFHGALATGLASWFNVTYVFRSDRFLPSNERSLLFRLFCTVSPPGLMWLLGFITLWQTTVFMFTSSCLLFACLLFCFFAYYTNLMRRDQTMLDRTGGPRRADDHDETPIACRGSMSGSMANVRRLLGHRWILAVLFPVCRSRLSTDGISAPVANRIAAF